MVMQPPTAATVVKMQHESYQSHVQSKRREVIKFRNQLMQTYTNPLKRSKQKRAEVQIKSAKNVTLEAERILT